MAVDPLRKGPPPGWPGKHGTVAANYFITCRCDVKGPGNDPDDHHMMCPLTNPDYWQAAHANALLDEIALICDSDPQMMYDVDDVRGILSKRVKP